MSISVVFFGGYKASQPDMDLWLGSARSSAKTYNSTPPLPTWRGFQCA